MAANRPTNRTPDAIKPIALLLASSCLIASPVYDAEANMNLLASQYVDDEPIEDDYEFSEDEVEGYGDDELIEDDYEFSEDEVESYGDGLSSRWQNCPIRAIPRDCRSFQIRTDLSLDQLRNQLKAKLRRCVKSGREDILVDGRDSLVGNQSVERVWQQLAASFAALGTIIPRYHYTTYEDAEGSNCQRADSVTFIWESDGATYHGFSEDEGTMVTVPSDRRKYTLRLFEEAMERHVNDFDASYGKWALCLVRKMNSLESRQFDAIIYRDKIVGAANIGIFEGPYGPFIGKKFSNMWPPESAVDKYLLEEGYAYNIESELIRWVKDQEKYGRRFRDYKALATELTRRVKNMANTTQRFSKATGNHQGIYEGQKRVFRRMRSKMASDASAYSCFPAAWLSKDIDGGNLDF